MPHYSLAMNEAGPISDEDYDFAKSYLEDRFSREALVKLIREYEHKTLDDQNLQCLQSLISKITIPQLRAIFILGLDSFDDEFKILSKDEKENLSLIDLTQLYQKALERFDQELPWKIAKIAFGGAIGGVLFVGLFIKLMCFVASKFPNQDGPILLMFLPVFLLGIISPGL